MIINRCEDCISYYIINSIRCCKHKPLLQIPGNTAMIRYLNVDIIYCEKFKKTQKINRIKDIKTTGD